MWILHKQLGDDIVLQNEMGGTVRLRLVGLLKTSIFQSELLISEENFLRHFPDQSGYGAFLVETQQSVQLTALLESRLKDVGLDAVSTAQKLAHFQEVENTYLSTFQTLGGLGLLLGTLGLGIVLLRNVIERRGELAVLRAFGFRRAVLSRMLLAENGFFNARGSGYRQRLRAYCRSAPCHELWCVNSLGIAGPDACHHIRRRSHRKRDSCLLCPASTVIARVEGGDVRRVNLSS